MKVYIHKPNSTKILAEIEPSTKIGDIISGYVPELANRADNLQDIEIYLEDQEEELSKDLTLGDLGKGKIHLHLNRCKKVLTTVVFAGKEYCESFPVSNTAKKVFHKAIKHFQIDEEDAADLFLFKGLENEKIIEETEHIGSFTEYPTCSATLYLSKEKGVQG